MTVIDSMETAQPAVVHASQHMVWLGIDPGKGGGVAMIDHNGVAVAHKLPQTERDTYDLLASFTDRWVRKCYLEKVSSSPQMGVRSAFTFGRGYGLLLGVLTGLRIPFEEVAPGVWQRGMKCMSGGDKNVTKRKAQQLFPDLKITHYVADALLIAEYARIRDLR